VPSLRSNSFEGATSKEYDPAMDYESYTVTWNSFTISAELLMYKKMMCSTPKIINSERNM